MEKRSFCWVNLISERLTKDHEYNTLSLPSREGKFPRPLWERVRVRGILVSIL